MKGKRGLRYTLSVLAMLSVVCAMLLFAVAAAADEGVPSAGPEGVDCYWGGVKFQDSDWDGVNRESGEPLLSGWTIKLIMDVSPFTEFTAVTQGDPNLGKWQFPDNLPTGKTYLVSEVLKSGWQQTYPNTNGGVYWIQYNGSGSYVLKSTAPSGYVAGSLNFGNAQLGSKGKIGDCVWHDDNRNGNGPYGCTKGPVWDNSENVIKDVGVRLVKKTGTNTEATVAGATTGADGKYLFTDLDAGEYRVDVLQPGVWAYFGGPFVTTTTEPYPYTLAQGETHLHADFGFDANLNGPVYVGDWVWYDIDKEGDQDEPASTGIPCVAVNLWVGPNSSNLTLIGTTNTDDWGNYAFPLLKPNAGVQRYFTSVGTAPEDPDVASFIVYYKGASPDHTCVLAPEFVDPNYLFSSGAASASMSQLMSPDGGTTPSMLSTYLPTAGGYDLTLDYGFSDSPTAVSIQSFGGTALPLASVEVLVAAAGALVAGALAWRRRR